MGSFINQFKAIFGSQFFLVIIILLVLIVTGIIVFQQLRIKQAKKHLDELEAKYVKLKNIPLSFKLNKAQALAKVNREVEKNISEYQSLYNLCQEELRQFSTVLAEIDDLIYSKKMNRIQPKFSAASGLAQNCDKQVNELNDVLDITLEQEREQREGINELKERFRNDKNQLLKNRGEYHKSVVKLDALIKDIENMFSIFEEWMFASEFNKAADKQQDIRQAIDELEDYLNNLPSYYEKCKVVIPQILDDIDYLYGKCKGEGIYLDHLDVERHLDVLKDANADILQRLDESNINHIGVDLKDIEANLTSLQEALENEENAFETISEKVNNTYGRIKKVNQEISKIKDLHRRIQERFGFQNLMGKIDSIESRIDKINEEKLQLDHLFDSKDVPYTKLLIKCEKLELNTTTIENECDELLAKLENACADEERADKQLLKLQLIVNDIRSKIIKNHLPSISEKYDDDILKANTLIIETRNILDKTPLDIERLNTKLQDAIDYIYTLYNNVNNLIGMAMMVENAIVFGNRYRSENSNVDDELTRAELCFNNGQYTKALKIAMRTIEKLHPGIYDKLMKEGSDYNA